MQAEELPLGDWLSIQTGGCYLVQPTSFRRAFCKSLRILERGNSIPTAPVLNSLSISQGGKRRQ